MNPPADEYAASANLVQTYFQLGLAISGSRRADHESYSACLGPFPHPICNFAANLRLEPWAARELAQHAVEQGAFHVYVLPSDRPKHIGELLARAGFEPTYQLVQMVAHPSAPQNRTELQLASEAERRRVAAFMADQFFSAQTSSFRKRVAEATGLASGLGLYYTAEGVAIQSALMTCRHEGMLGVYNLCVATQRRGRGHGKQLVAWTKQIAYEEGLLATLQCDRRLESWYAAQGFQAAGNVDVYALSKMQHRVIIDSG